MARRMADETFRKEQWTNRYASHIAPVNELVDDLRANHSRGWVPYLAPMYGGVNARLLSILRDPGPKTQEGCGSGFLCMENDDPTAEAICGFFAEVEIAATDIVPWNAYPWYINRAPNAAEIAADLEPLNRLLAILPYVRVVMLHSDQAHASWKHFALRYPHVVAERKLRVIPTYHTSRQAFWHPDAAVRQARRLHLANSFSEAADSL